MTEKDKENFERVFKSDLSKYNPLDDEKSERDLITAENMEILKGNIPLVCKTDDHRKHIKFHIIDDFSEKSQTARLEHLKLHQDALKGEP